MGGGRRVGTVVLQVEGVLVERRERCEFRATPTANPHPVGSAPLRDHRASTGRTHVRIWSAKRRWPRTCSHGYPHCHGGKAFYGEQLGANGAGLPQRRFGSTDVG